jgi:NAD+ kinase
VTIYRPYKDHLSKHFKLNTSFPVFETAADLAKDVDCLISLGGDGTMLNTILLVRDSGIPVVGLNIGRLGFLSAIPKENVEEALLSIVDRKYTLDKRVMLQAYAKHAELETENVALNEITVLKKDTSSMIRINTWLNNEFFTTYWADGLIISTPTGSTGYSLSCGGPIIMPESRNFVLTPIAPHNLNMRPVIIPDDTEIRLTVESRNKSFLLSLDSRSYSLKKGEEIIIKKCNYSINLVKLHSISHISTLRNKLLWGIDKRN